MSDNRKYYYLKLKESYFDDDAIVLLGHAPQPEAFRQRSLGRTAGRRRHLRSQRCQPDAQRLPHRPEAGQQNAAAPEGAAALFHQDADAPFRRGDGVAAR